MEVRDCCKKEDAAIDGQFVLRKSGAKGLVPGNTAKDIRRMKVNGLKMVLDSIRVTQSLIVLFV